MALTAKKVYAILKRQISDMEAKLNSPVRYRGTVATADLLPINPDIGDMYNIESKSVYGEAGMNVAWNGVVWDTMGAPIDMSLYLTKEEAEAVIQRLVTEYLEKNPVKPGATTEQAQQIEQNKTDIASLKTETSSLKESISTKITKFYASSQGEIHLADSDNGKIMDMMLYGKSSQDGTPSPENPVEIKSVVNPTVKVSNEDGTKSQTVTLPYTLNAIPVSSGGNVTIDGQQYIAGYVDVERGKLVRMTELREYDGTENWDLQSINNNGIANFQIQTPKMYIGNTGMCDTFQLQTTSISNTNTEGFMVNNNASLFIRINTARGISTLEAFKEFLANKHIFVLHVLRTPTEIDLAEEEITAFKTLATYYPTTNISVNSEQLDGYTVFNYPISMQNGWNYVKQQLNDNRDYIYDMDAQSAEAYVNSEYAVALTELEV